MNLFNFNELEILTFFAVLVRYSVLFSVLPLVGDHYIPMPIKILLSLSVSIALYPGLVSRGYVHPADAAAWGATTGGIVGTIALEVVLALALGFTAKCAFEAINVGGNLVGNFMGFGMASTYDPGQETQTQVVAQLQVTLAMLVFLVLDGHHVMLRAALQSYQVVGIGGLAHVASLGFGRAFAQKMIELTGTLIVFGIQLSAPVAVVLFALDVAFGVMARALPSLNVLALSTGALALVGLGVLFLTIPEYQSVSTEVLGRVGDWMEAVLHVLAEGK